MSQSELVRTIVQQLEACGVPFMLTGSLVSSLQGEPRMSHDVDWVVELDESQVPQVVAAFPSPRYYLSEPAIREAIASQRTFNLLDNESGEKADFWLLTDQEFDVSRFARRIKADVSGVECFVSTPEDTILQKLLWSELYGGSEKQFTDALRVYEVQRDQLDDEYIQYWANQLELQPAVDALRRRSS